jgi:DNA-binding transcriptional ArsR family regulator
MSRTSSAVDVFHAVADGNRRGLLDHLARGEAAVGALVDRSGLSYSAVSQHLAILLDVGLVTRREDGRQRFYTLEPAPLREIHDWTSRYESFWHKKLRRPRSLIDEDT